MNSCIGAVNKVYIFYHSMARHWLCYQTIYTYPGFFCILMFCGLFFRFNSFPFLNHLNLRDEYSELVSHRSTSLEPAADSWLLISFNRGGKAKKEKKREKILIIFQRGIYSRSVSLIKTRFPNVLLPETERK